MRKDVSCEGRVAIYEAWIFEFGKPNKLNQLIQLNQPNKHSKKRTKRS